MLENKPTVLQLTTHFDDRGDLTELIHDHDLKACGVPFGQVYVVRNPSPDCIRGYHRHVRLWDFFTVVHGKAKVICIPPDHDSRDPLESAQTFILNDKQMQMLVIPPGWWHGWMNLETPTIMVCTGSEVYNRDNPDEERNPVLEFTGGEEWFIQPR